MAPLSLDYTALTSLQQNFLDPTITHCCARPLPLQLPRQGLRLCILLTLTTIHQRVLPVSDIDGTGKASQLRLLPSCVSVYRHQLVPIDTLP